MNEPEDTPRSSISKARSLEEIADFWDTHSLADYWDQTREVTFEVRAQRQRRITLDPDVYAFDLTFADLDHILAQCLDIARVRYPA